MEAELVSPGDDRSNSNPMAVPIKICSCIAVSYRNPHPWLKMWGLVFEDSKVTGWFGVAI